jgi:hypothetical protein
MTDAVASGLLQIREKRASAKQRSEFLVLMVVAFISACSQRSTPENVTAFDLEPGTNVENEYVADRCSEILDSSAFERRLTELDAQAQPELPEVLPDEIQDPADATGLCGDAICSEAEGENCATCPSDCGCPLGQECNQGGGCCKPTVCSTLGFECGEFEDPCGGTVDCGGCLEEGNCVDGVCTLGICKPSPVEHLSGDVRLVRVVDKAAYIITGSDLRVLDVTDEHDPVWLSRLQLEPWPVQVEYANGLLYVLSQKKGEQACGVGSNCVSLDVVDVSEPAAPVIVGSTEWPVPGSLDSPSSGMAIGDEVIYVLAFGGGPYVVDVSSSISPALLTDPLTLDSNDLFYSIKATGSNLYLAGPSLGVLLYDLSTPEEPVQVSVWQPPATSWVFEVNHNTGLIVDGHWNAYVLNLSVPSSPVVLWSQQVMPETCWYVEGYLTPSMAIFYGECLNAGKKGLIRIFDMQSSGELVQQTELSVDWVEGVTLSSAVLYFAAGSAGLQSYQMNSGKILQLTPQGAPIKELLNLAIYEQFGFAGGTAGWQILDLSIPYEPKQIVALPSTRTARSIIPVGDIAYVLSAQYEDLTLNDFRLETWDVSHVSSPKKLAETPLLGQVTAVREEGGRLYWLSRLEEAGETLLFRAVPASGMALESEVLFSTDKPAFDLLVRNQQAYILWLGGPDYSIDKHGIQILDLSNDGGVLELGEYVNSPHLYSSYLAALDSLVAIAGAGTESDDEQLHLIDVSEPTVPQLSTVVPIGHERIVATHGLFFLAERLGFGFAVVDALNSSGAQIITDVSLPQSYSFQDMAVESGYAFLVNPWLTVVDVRGCWGGE